MQQNYICRKTIYAEKLFHNNFTEFGVKFVLRLHYKGKIKKDQIINEKLCLGNLSSQWTTSESKKTGV